MAIVKIEEVGGESLDRVSKILANIPGGVQKANYQALKRAGETAKTKASQLAVAQYSITKSTFMHNTRQKTHVHGGAGHVEMSLSFSGSVIPLISFQTRASRSGGVSASVTRNGGASSLAHAFVANIYGARGIWERLGKPRFPVRQLYGPSGPQMINNDTVVQELEQVISSTYESRMEREILRLMNGW